MFPRPLEGRPRPYCSVRSDGYEPSRLVCQFRGLGLSVLFAGQWILGTIQWHENEILDLLGDAKLRIEPLLFLINLTGQ